MGMCKRREERCTNLIEADAGENLLHAPLKLTIWRSERDVGSANDAGEDVFGGATTSGQQGDGAATPLDDDRTRVTVPRKGATSRTVVVRDDGEFAGRELDVGVLVVAHEGLQATHPTSSGARGCPVLDHHHGGVAIGVKMLRVEDLVQGNDAANGEFAVCGVLVALAIVKVGEHLLQESRLVELVTCIIKSK